MASRQACSESPGCDRRKAAQGNGRELQLCLKERWFHVGAPSNSDGFRRSIAKGSARPRALLAVVRP